MRFVAASLFWLLTTVALAVAVVAMWAQHTVIDRDGYSGFAASAAREPAVQDAMAALLTNEVVALAADNGYGNLNPELVGEVAAGYTRNDGFPGQFAQANRIVHTWMFTDSIRREEGSNDRWLIDVAPMLRDSSLRSTLGSLNLSVPDTLTVPITVSDTSALRPGQLRVLATWGPWASAGAAVLAGVFALLTLASARSRGKALGALGVSALLVGAAGWGGMEVSRRYIADALDQTAADVRPLAEAMIGQAEGSLHHWLNLTLAAGGALVVLGVVASMLGGLRRRD